MTSYSLNYGMLPDGTFSLTLLDVEEANEDFHDKWEDRPDIFIYELLEELSSNDIFEINTSLDIMMRSISDETRQDMLSLVGAGYEAITIELDAFEDKDDKDGIKLDLDPHTLLLCDLETDDHGDIIKIHRIWVFPQSWMSSFMLGETIILINLTS